ncbi:MAG TPA: protein kinase [Actinocrinis sp.]|nr:protein kinase [Actinocrinis sp.]
MEPLSGDDPAQVAGYQVRARLGAGGMGRVYLAHTPGGRPVALKMVRPEFGADQDFRERFRREVDAARRVHGLYTAQVLDADPDGMPPWLVTAYVPGPSLQQAVKQHGALPVESVYRLMAGVAEALSAIHAAGVVHRDLKPSNVLLAPDGPRVIDFGIAQAVDASALTRLGMRVGSPQFMAPEQVLGRPPTAAIDVFALGHLAAYALLGRSVFGTGEPAAVFPRILHEAADLEGCPPRLRPLIEQCLRKDPDARPAPAEVLAACREYQTPQTVQVVDTWLPPAMAASLAQHVAPAPRGPVTQAPPSAPSAPSQPQAAPQAPPQQQPHVQPRSQPQPQPPQQPRPQPQPQPQMPPRPQPQFPTAPAAMAQQPISRQPIQPQPMPRQPAPQQQMPQQQMPQPPSVHQPHLAPPPTRPQVYMYGAQPKARSFVPRTPAARAVSAVAIIAVLAVLAIVILRSTGSSNSINTLGSTSPTPSSGASQGGGQSGGAAPTSAIDPCLVGTWTGVHEEVTNTIDNNPVKFTGVGPNETFNADGTGSTDYGAETDYNGTAEGETWLEKVSGGATGHYETRNGTLLTSTIQAHGTWTLLENGVFNNSGELSMDDSPAQYTCSGDTLQIHPPHGSVSLVRKTR